MAEAVLQTVLPDGPLPVLRGEPPVSDHTARQRRPPRLLRRKGSVVLEEEFRMVSPFRAACKRVAGQRNRGRAMAGNRHATSGQAQNRWLSTQYTRYTRTG